MSKKQLILVSSIAAIPGAILLVFLVMGLLQGMLSDTANVSVMLWIVWVLAALASASVAFLPFAIMFFPGLMPEPAAAGFIPSDEPAAGSRRSQPVDEDGAADDDQDEYEDDVDSEDSEDDGEQLFEDDALGDDFDDEYSDSFDDDKK